MCGCRRMWKNGADIEGFVLDLVKCAQVENMRDQKVKITNQTDVPVVSWCATALKRRRSLEPRRCQRIQRLYFSAPRWKGMCTTALNAESATNFSFYFPFRAVFLHFYPYEFTLLFRVFLVRDRESQCWRERGEKEKKTAGS